jgi:hypothetical protein
LIERNPQLIERNPQLIERNPQLIPKEAQAGEPDGIKHVELSVKKTAADLVIMLDGAQYQCCYLIQRGENLIYIIYLLQSVQT